MNFNLISNIETCFSLVRDTVNVSLIYYTHIPASIISLIIGFFVFSKNKTLAGRILFFIAITFSLWIVCSLITWTSYDSRMYMFFWAFFGILTALIYVLSAYFCYVFLFDKDINFYLKLVLFLLLLPIVLLTPSRFDIQSFDLTWCIATENPNFMWYYYAFGIVSFLVILFLGFVRYLNETHQGEKRKIAIFTLGVSIFVLFFWFTSFLASYLSEGGFVSNFNLEPYGLSGMVIFMGFLGYLIVKYKAFDIKLLGAQALVVSLVILIASQFFFIQNNTNRILTGITLAMTLGFGYFLIKSVKLEVQRKEELQMMADKLASANDQLRKLDNAKTEFISIASHQLRTPLTSVKGFVSLILEGTYGEISPQVKDALVKVYSSAERLIQLVEDLLNISRIEAGRMQYSFEKGDLMKVVQEINDNFVLVAKAKDMYLDLKVPEEKLPEVFMDSGKIREVVSNLVDNAFKYTPKGGVTLKVEVPDSEKVRITVSDTGIGVPKDEVQNLFKKFSRGKDTTRLHASGTGLGLYVGKEIINAHKGNIWLESDGEGKGTRFIIELPINQPSA